MKSLLPKNWRQRRGLPPRCGRFDVDRCDDGWMAVDNAYGTCIGFDTKREATEACRLARAYVKVHGDIDFSSFPYDLDQPLTYDLVDDIRRHWERDYPALDNQKKGHPNEYPHAHP